MKFGQQLNESAVPEWRAKYLDYKQGKKKLKAVARAIRNADKSPHPNRTPFAGTSARDGPVQDLIRRGRPGQDDGPDSEHTPRPEPNTRPIPVNERSPLREALDTQHQRPNQRMTRYGSIIGSPQGDSASDTLERVKSAGQSSRMSERVAPSLELPAPAMGPRLSPHHSLAGGDTSPTSPGDVIANLPPSDLESLPEATSAQKYAATAPHPERANTLNLQRSNSEHRVNTPRKPLLKRIFSLNDSTSAPIRQQDVALEAYQDLDAKQANFFAFMDKELKKIETFYVTKENDANERLSILREQLHIMRSRRLEEIQAAEQSKQDRHLSEATANGDKNGFLSASKLGATGNLASRHITSAVGRVDQAIGKIKTGQIGKTSKAMGQFGSPIARIMDPSRQDYSRRATSGGVSYREAKRKLKIALAEYYRGLELLKSYSMTNRTAFRKIMKKYDKTVNYAQPTNRFIAEKVNTAHFVNSDVVDSHIQAVEDLYARYFERGSRKIAVNKLRAKVNRADDFTGSIWRQGVMATAGIVFGIEGLVYGVESLYNPDDILRVHTSYLLQLYGGYFLLLALTALFVCDCRIFSRARVNYQFVFEFDTRHTLDWRQLSEMPAFACLLLGLVMWLNFSRFGGDTMYIYWPVVLIGISAVMLLLPPPDPYVKSRVWFLNSNWRMLLSGVYPVEFRDFFLGDMYCSQTYAFGNIEMFFCLYAKHWNNPPSCNSSHSRLFGFFQTLPGIIRALQCLRRYADTRNVFPHLVNFGKYSFTILVYVSLSLWRIDRNDGLMAVFIVFSIINSLYCITWDIFMDWSLGDAYAKNKFLRSTLAYKRHWWYYSAIFIDVVLRFNWIFYIIYRNDTQHSTIVSFFISFSEVIRRGIWVIFRVENEHCTNVGKFRASRDVSLPYSFHEDVSASPDSQRTEDRQAQGQEQGQQSEEGEDGFAASDDDRTSPSISHYASRTTGTDLERQSTRSTALRNRRASAAADTPVSRALKRVGSTVAAAHSQDYERRKKLDGTDDRGEDEEDEDDDDDQSSDEN
ncbi:EXS-domain-containing protein [Polychaeton citri CBS 116435]|uniref:EXS-domain-containing protein n=1 Tax=Polychaeton citri CBS 116435 TaxID=1314669 RepID=A0A9P4QEU2_9PEZI|nr:EXS-domain-containing protein [Polychaeton citri CBS 116435]